MMKDESDSKVTRQSPIDKIQDWTIKYLRAIVVMLGVLSTAVFIAWLIITLIWPAQDVQRTRATVSLINAKTLVVDYPKRFLADEQSLPVYLTIDNELPISITIDLSSNLPLVLTSVEPIFASKVSHVADGRLILSWPVTTAISSTTDASGELSIIGPTLPTSSTATSSTPVTVTPTSNTPTSHTPTLMGGSPIPANMTPKPTIMATIPIISQPSTVVLYFKNARSAQGWPPFGGFQDTSFSIAGSGNPVKIDIQVETTGRAAWRVFAKEYPFIAILPLLFTLLGFLRKTYTDRQKQQRKNAAKEVERFKEAISITSAASPGQVGAQYVALAQLRKYLSGEDWNRATKLLALSKGRDVLGQLSPDIFANWPDSWAGALKLAKSAISKQDPQDDTSDVESGTTSQNKETVTDYPTLDRATFRGLIRIFPRDLLSIPAEQRFRALIKDLQLSPISNHEWPRPPDPPIEYSKNDVLLPPLTVQRMGLFPVNNADTPRERSYLFAETTKWFWPKHPIYQEIQELADRVGVVLVHGRPGVGRTTLALSLTRYAKPKDGVISSYHTGPVGRVDVQLSLAHEILRFARWCSPKLTNLDPDDRDLLARLLLTMFDSQYLLSQLNSYEQQQTEGVTNDEQAFVWQEEALLELRLLHQSVERMAFQHPMQLDRWFLGFVHCAQRLEFQCVRIALDMTHEDWANWHGEHLESFLHLLHSDYPIPLQVFIMVEDPDQDIDCKIHGLAIRELRWILEKEKKHEWDAPLKTMLQHRAIQRGILENYWPSALPALAELSEAAHGNPRRLADLWQEVERQFPAVEAVTGEMIRAAQEKIS